MSTRERLLKRHEQNIERERSAGVIKPYVNLEPYIARGSIDSARESASVESFRKS